MIEEFTIPLHRFDLNLLTPEARQIGSEAFQNAVALHFALEYAASGLGAMVGVDDSGIKVMTFRINADPLEMVMPMPQAGSLAEAVPYLEALTKQAPDHAQVLYNLVICYSELGQLDETIIRLKRAMQLVPLHAYAWVGIGMAYYRMKKPAAAAEAFNKAIEADPGDAYARSNLGGVLTAMGDAAKAVPHLRLALESMPDDPQSLLGLACALDDLGMAESMKEADGLFLRVVEEHSTLPVARMAAEARAKLAQRRGLL